MADMDDEALKMMLAQFADHVKAAKKKNLMRPKVDMSTQLKAEAPDMIKGSDVPDDLKPGHDVQMDPTEGGLTLDGVMNLKGNSGKDLAEGSSLTPEELEEILKGAK